MASSRTLVDLCLIQIAYHLPAFAPDLSRLPFNLADRLFRHAVSLNQPPASLSLSLHIFADLFWRPWAIATHSDALSLRLLPLFSDSLVRLDLSCCWVRDTEALSQLQQLQCLDLSRSTLTLDSQQVGHLTKLSKLRCLTLQYSQVISEPQNRQLDQLLAGLPGLRALDISGLPMEDDSTINLLTYGHQYSRWKENVRLLASGKEATNPKLEIEESGGDAMQQYPLSELVYLRMAACEGITDKVAEYLTALPEIAFLDVRFTTHLRGSSFANLKAKHGLTSLPNNSKLLYRSNATLKTAMEGGCGCRALASARVYILENEPRESQDALSFEYPEQAGRKAKRWEEEGLGLLFESEARTGSLREVLANTRPLASYGHWL